MLRFGTVSNLDSAKCRARVKFEEDGIVSDWLPIVVAKAAKDSYFHIPDVGEQVACMMDENSENGVILGAIYSTNVTPKQAGNDLASVQFSDGTKIVYDRAAHTLLVDTKGKITIKTTSDVAVECVNATVKASTKTTMDTPNAEFTGNVKVAGNLNITGNTSGQGNISTQGTVTATGDVKAGIISLLQHKHTETGGVTSPPIP